MVPIQNFKLIVVKKERYQRITYTYKMRDVSNRVAEQYSIKHESPQVLYIKDGMVVWNTSHWNIKKDALEENIKKKKQAKGACFFFVLLKYI